MGSRGRQTTDAIRDNQPDEETVSGCFDFRLRTRSFDLHQVAQHRRLKKLGFHFRSESDTDIRAEAKKSSIQSSKSNSQLPSANRRFVRVVRDSQNPDLENPHVIHRFSQDYLEHLNIERANSFSEGVKPLPYLARGHTILKKQATIDKSEVDLAESPSGNKHAKFFDEVLVIEFDKQCTICKDLHVSHKERLHDETDEAEGTVGEVNVEKIIQPEEHDNHLSHMETGLSAEEDQISADNEVFLPNESACV